MTLMSTTTMKTAALATERISINLIDNDKIDFHGDKIANDDKK